MIGALSPAQVVNLSPNEDFVLEDIFRHPVTAVETKDGGEACWDVISQATSIGCGEVREELGKKTRKLNF